MGAVVNFVQPFLERVGFNFRASPTKSSLFTEQAVDKWLKLMMEVVEPDEVLKKAGVTRAMLRALTGDDEITTAMDTRREALLAIPWRLEPVGSDPDSKVFPEPVNWLWMELEPHMEKVLRASLEALLYGYSVMEAVYAPSLDGRRVTWGEITEKPFEWFIPRLDGTVLYRSSRDPRGEETDPRKFFLTARNQTYRQPMGEAMFSRLWWPYLFRSQGWRFWIKRLERFGTPFLIGHTAGDAQELAEKLATMTQNATIAVGMSDTVGVIETRGGGGDFPEFERMVCARIQKLILGQTLTTDSGGSSGNSGSYALGQVHNEVRKDRRDSDARMCTRTVQRMVDVIWALNNFPGLAPRFVLQDSTGLEQDRATRDATLVGQKIVRLTKPYLLRTYDFEEEDIIVDDPVKMAEAIAGTKPKGDEEEDEDEGAAPAVEASLASNTFASNDQLIARKRFTAKQQAVEDALEPLLADLPQAISPTAIANAIRAAESPQDLADKLATLLADADPIEFRTTLERALFAADLLGYVHAGPVPPKE